MLNLSVILLHLQGADSFFDDCIHHLICPFCTLTQVCIVHRYHYSLENKLYPLYALMVQLACDVIQESKTLEMNNVHDGIWHGRGDTLCIGVYPEGKAFLELHSPPVIVSTMSSEA